MSASLQENDSGDQRVAPAVEGAGQDDPAFPAKAEFQHCGNEATEPDASWSRTLGRPVLHPLAGRCRLPYRSVFFILSMTSGSSPLYHLVPVCRLSMREKGKKRAKSVKSLISGLLIGSGLGHLVAVVQAGL